MSKQKKQQEAAAVKADTYVFFIEVPLGETVLKVSINALCRADIAMDYARKYFVKAIQSHIAALEKEEEVREDLILSLKSTLTDVVSLVNTKISIKDPAGNDIRFDEDMSQSVKKYISPLTTYRLSKVTDDGAVVAVGLIEE